MCTAVGMGLNILGGLFSAFGASGAHSANASYLDAQAEIAEMQAQAAQQILQQHKALRNTQAEESVKSTQYAAGMQASAARGEGQSIVKAQRSAMGSRGLSQSTTYQDILDDTISRSERDALAIQYNADVESHNIYTRAKLENLAEEGQTAADMGNLRMSAMQYRQQASQERSAGRMALGTGLLSTATNFASAWSGWSSTSMGRSGGGGSRGINYRLTMPTYNWRTGTSSYNGF